MHWCTQSFECDIVFEKLYDWAFSVIITKYLQKIESIGVHRVSSATLSSKNSMTVLYRQP